MWRCGAPSDVLWRQPSRWVPRRVLRFENAARVDVARAAVIKGRATFSQLTHHLLRTPGARGPAHSVPVGDSTARRRGDAAFGPPKDLGRTGCMGSRQRKRPPMLLG
eukprot:scaffold15316_cov69-Phaeocystis_antarctica.AAC.10